MGKIVAITKGSMHGSSVSNRLLQRWLLQMNAHLAETEGKIDSAGRESFLLIPTASSHLNIKEPLLP